MKNQEQDNKYYVCYSPKIFKFIRHEKKIDYIVTGLHRDTLKPFWLFEKDEQVKNALDEYHNTYKN